MIDKMDIPGTCFRVVFIPAGETPEHYPAAKDEKEDLVEFYDRDYRHTSDGQFITRYYLRTLVKDAAELMEHGLDLMGHVSKWKVSGEAMTETMLVLSDAVRRHQAEQIELEQED